MMSCCVFAGFGLSSGLLVNVENGTEMGWRGGGIFFLGCP